MKNSQTIGNAEIDLKPLCAGAGLRRGAAQWLNGAENLSSEVSLQQLAFALELQSAELRRVQTRLDSERARYLAFYEQAPVAYLTLSEQGGILQANRTAAALLGVEPGMLLKRPISHFVSKDAQGSETLRWRQLVASGGAQRYELAMLRDDGTPFWGHLAASVGQGENGEAELHLVLSDISERKQSEEQNHHLLMENKTILNNALVGIVYLKQHRVVSCNRRFEELLGYLPGELIGESSECFYDTHENFMRIGERAYAALAVKRNHTEELLLRHKDGHVFWGALNGCAIDPAQPNEGSIWIYADISERRKAEEASRKLLQCVEQAAVSIIITNRDGCIEYVNPYFSRVTGYSRHEALGQKPSILQSGKTPASTYLELWRTITSGDAWRGILQNHRKDGEVIWEDTSISPIHDQQGVISNFIAVKEDVSERIRSQQLLANHQAQLEELVEQRTSELRAALDAAKSADQAKDAFLANVTHELRTPLSAVIGFAGLARPFSTAPLQREYLDKITSAGQTLSGLIDDLLDLSKIAAGRMTLEITTFSLSTLIARCRSVMSFKVNEKALQLIEQIDDDVPDVLQGDPLRLEQILLNLLSNAVKFTPSGHIKLRIGVQARKEGRVCLKIEVEDSGIGMSAKELKLLFKPFAQADASMSRKFGGTGLGLAICKRLAGLMDGRISVSSRPGCGTTFCVKVWLALGKAGELPSNEPSSEPLVPCVFYHDAQVLVADDQPFNREVVEALLVAVGIRPRLTANGQEALDLLHELGPKAFDLVLMDVQMPVLDGLSAIRELRSRCEFSELPVIAMTAHTMAHEKERGMAAGMNDHIGKPFDEVSFYRVLAKWIPLAKQHAQALMPRPAAAAQASGLPHLSGIQTDVGLALMLGNEARYRHWLSNFVKDGPEYVVQMSQALAIGELEPAALAAHTLKGRSGMLGMTSLHNLAAALEIAIDSGEPAQVLLSRVEQCVAILCAEISSSIGLPVDREPTSASPLATQPTGPVPGAVRRLIAMLETSDGDCDRAALRCLEALAEPAWAPHLHKALAQVQNFDLVAVFEESGGNLHSAVQGE